MSELLDALDILGWNKNDDPQSAHVQADRLAKVKELASAELTAEVDKLRARVAELEAQLEAVAKPARRTKASPAETAEPVAEPEGHPATA